MLYPDMSVAPHLDDVLVEYKTSWSQPFSAKLNEYCRLKVLCSCLCDIVEVV